MKAVRGRLFSPTALAALTALLVMGGCAQAPSPPIGSPIASLAERPPPSAATPALPPPPDGSSDGRVQPAAMMAVPRAVHSATRIADGRILVAGGCSTNGCDLGSVGGGTAELFDPVLERFDPTGSLTISRDDHSAVLLPDGRVMLVGGWGSTGVLATTDIYDPATGSFRPGPTMRSGRAGIEPVTLDDGKVLLAGGFTGDRPTTAATELFDPASGTIRSSGDMTTGRGAYAAGRLPDGRVLIAGGLSDGEVTASAELYDPATATFAPTGPMRTARYKGGTTALADGTILVFGGSGDIDGTILFASTEIYDPATGAFHDGPSMRSPRYKLPAASITFPGGDVLVAGGAPQPEVYRSASRSFQAVAGSLDAARLFLTATAIDDHRALLVGGYDGAIRPTAQAWLFTDP